MTLYDTILLQTVKILKQTQKSANFVASTRLFSAITFFFIIFYISRNGISTVSTIVCVSSFIIFFSFVYYDQKLLKRSINSKSIISICQNELLALQGSIHQFEDGVEYKDSNHYFSFDLDIFGNKSLFQLINRCFTRDGKNKLARYLITHTLEEDEIVSRQASIKELKNRIEWRVNFLAAGQLLEKNEEKTVKLKDWLAIDDIVYFSKYKVLLWLVPLLSIITFLLFVIGFISIQLYSFVTIAQLLLAGVGRKNIKNSYFSACLTIPQLKGFIELFTLIENEKFTTASLNNLPKVSQKLQKLVGVGDAFNLRNNVIGGLILNTFFLWDYQCAFRFEVWKKNMLKIY